LSKVIKSKKYKKEVKMPRLDKDFLCGRCGGTLLPTGRKINDLDFYSCSICGVGEQVLCPKCHSPRTLWAKPYEECMFCSDSLNFSSLKGLIRKCLIFKMP
jgi:transcription elongation factor Elf1